ncbi:type VII secretion target [Nocardia sp. CC227C]|uniref:type VII secretion target n=1 Tax=Nocardia sp. CC227C TaxID=3044562 RepID=UPI00278C538B|nr:type VII secretion target [Nocardia sp. CC227C]
MTVGFDPEKMRALATHVRDRANAISEKTPVAGTSRNAARSQEGGGMAHSAIAVSIEETLKTLDTVLENYHVRTLREIADKTDASAAVAEAMDNNNAEMMPR